MKRRSTRRGGRVSRQRVARSPYPFSSRSRSRSRSKSSRSRSRSRSRSISRSRSPIAHDKKVVEKQETKWEDLKPFEHTYNKILVWLQHKDRQLPKNKKSLERLLNSSIGRTSCRVDEELVFYKLLSEGIIEISARKTILAKNPIHHEMDARLLEDDEKNKELLILLVLNKV